MTGRCSGSFLNLISRCCSPRTGMDCCKFNFNVSCDYSLEKNLRRSYRWDWDKKFSVIKISFGGDVCQSSEYFEKTIAGLLHKNEKDNGVTAANKETIGNYFKFLIEACHEKYQMPVVVLVDEYDITIECQISNVPWNLAF